MSTLPIYYARRYLLSSTSKSHLCKLTLESPWCLATPNSQNLTHPKCSNCTKPKEAISGPGTIHIKIRQWCSELKQMVCTPEITYKPTLIKWKWLSSMGQTWRNEWTLKRKKMIPMNLITLKMTSQIWQLLKTNTIKQKTTQLSRSRAPIIIDGSLRSSVLRHYLRSGLQRTVLENLDRIKLSPHLIHNLSIIKSMKIQRGK